METVRWYPAKVLFLALFQATSCGRDGDEGEFDTRDVGVADGSQDIGSDIHECTTECVDGQGADLDAREVEVSDGSDDGGPDVSECSLDCTLGTSIYGRCCDETLAYFGQEIPTFSDATARALQTCPCAVPDYAARSAHCVVNRDYVLSCREFLWVQEANDFYPEDGLAGCSDRLDWIVENTRWISLEDVTDRDALREHVDLLQPCPDPYGGEL